jgi:hypothetical protein
MAGPALSFLEMPLRFPRSIRIAPGILFLRAVQDPSGLDRALPPHVALLPIGLGNIGNRTEDAG